MIKTIKNILAGLLVVPMIALSVGVLVPMSVSAQTSDASCDTSNLDINSGAKCSQGNGQPTNLFGGDGSIFNTIVNAMLFLIGAISVIMLIFGGIRYTISGGDTAAVTSAKNTILYAVVGIVVALLAYAIVNFVLVTLVSTS